MTYWFRARRHGIGWVPSTWQGWLVLLIYVIALGYSFSQLHEQYKTIGMTLLNFIPKALLITAVLTIITYLKGEPTSWRASHKKKNNLS